MQVSVGWDMNEVCRDDDDDVVVVVVSARSNGLRRDESPPCLNDHLSCCMLALRTSTRLRGTDPPCPRFNDEIPRDGNAQLLRFRRPPFALRGRVSAGGPGMWMGCQTYA